MILRPFFVDDGKAGGAWKMHDALSHDSKRDKSLLLSMIKKEIRLFTAWYSANELLLLFALDATQTIFQAFLPVHE